ncbi:hypothetical protein M5689_007184 [Euphorbia peplus]|nr:hypothetical protein M5689_007184 [Euphorbia peplus]
MASSSSSSSSISASSSHLFKPSRKHIVDTHRSCRVSALSRRDEGMWSTDIVEANLSVLKERIMEVKIKEKLERCCKYENGWNYQSEYNYNFKKQRQVSQFHQLLGLVFGTFGFTCLTSTFFLYFVSLIIHLNH